VARARPGEDRQVEAERERLGAGGVVGVGVGQRDRHEASPVGGDRTQDRVGRRVRGIARVDDDDLPAADEVGVRGLAGHRARGTHLDPRQTGPLPDDVRRRRGTGHDPGGDVLEPGRELELLEGRAGRDPHRELPGGHRLERVPRGQPAMVDDLLGLEGRLGAGRQLRGVEPRGEAAGHDRRRRPLRDRHEAVGPEPEIERLDDAAQRGLAREQRPARSRDRRRVERTPVAPLGQEDARLFEQLADRRDRERGLLAGRPHGDQVDQPLIRVGVVNPAAREDEQVAGEGHRRRPLGEQDLGRAAARSDQDDGRGGSRRSGVVGHREHRRTRP
jgi:hypothetical protein